MRLKVKLNIIDIPIPPILDKINKEVAIKNILKNNMSISVATPPVAQKSIILRKVLFLIILFIDSIIFYRL